MNEYIIFLIKYKLSVFMDIKNSNLIISFENLYAHLRNVYRFSVYKSIYIYIYNKLFARINQFINDIN